ncbi:hypothetical protein QM467_12735 [Rhodoblastus sp. 17X3]|uniref:hypothetical protein n=1 Tax=Rhodoblastus sp. 17X3 TaxID=3047026 RepID=UPI0024B72519|nr:hypothetical protein [Rhodoblastus sp. 17X3]MDI9848923.1 hypothetical protein [Rhodoblastus sp. 17X3]
MPQDIVNAMRNLREEIRQRLLQAPEYRALVTLDRSIEEICSIMQEAPAPASLSHLPAARTAAPEHPPIAVLEPAAQPTAPARHHSIANAFAETLAARMEQRPAARPAPAFPLAARAAG